MIKPGQCQSGLSRDTVYCGGIHDECWIEVLGCNNGLYHEIKVLHSYIYFKHNAGAPDVIGMQ